MALFPYIADAELPHAMLALLTIVSADNATTLRVVNNNEKINSGGHEFQAYPFDLVLMGDTGDRAPTVSLSIDNADQMLMTEIRRLYEAPSVKLQLVFSNQPDVIEKEIDFLTLSQVEYDSFKITGSLAAHTFLQERFPRGIYDASQYPDLHFSVT